MKSKKGAGFELLYILNGMGDGQQANNPWLQEFPDPITRVLGIIMLLFLMLKKWMSNEIVANGGLTEVMPITTADGSKLENVPVIVQPGSWYLLDWFCYGRKAALKEEMQVGLNATLYKGFNDVQSVLES
jgi:molybdopterin-containing oxidoreductase family iron-sulfur binding subunit